MDAVFKLLHVEVARKATNGIEKKNEGEENFLRFAVCKIEENRRK